MNGDLISVSEQIEKIRVKEGANLAHTGWARMDYTLSKAWRIGLETQIKYGKTSDLIKKKFTNKEEIKAYIDKVYPGIWDDQEAMIDDIFEGKASPGLPPLESNFSRKLTTP